MLRTLLKSKIHRAVVTDANLQYQGSVTLDPELMAAADILPFERIEIYNVTNGERFATYAIAGRAGAGEVVINGAAAHKAGRGDVVILATYATFEEEGARSHAPRLVFVDAANRVQSLHSEAVAIADRVERCAAAEADGIAHKRGLLAPPETVAVTGR